MEQYKNEAIDLLFEIEKLYGFGIIYLWDNTEDIWKRFLEKGDDYIKDKKIYHNLKVEFGKWISRFECFKVVKINVFRQEDYRNKIIDKILLPDYEYKRNG